MKKLLWFSQFVFFVCFNFFLLLTAYQLVSPDNGMQRLRFTAPLYDQKEDFDQKLSRLNSVLKIGKYCDSLFEEKIFSGQEKNFEKAYAEIASAVVRNRFYHGYSVYSFSDNYMAMLLGNLSVDGLSAIVIPDDILKYPYAACSQQSIVLMEILKRKRIATRKVGFKGKQGGHFCFEVYYEGAWHFYDTDMEPNDELLAKHNRPGIAYLTKHPALLKEAYGQYPEEKIDDLFSSYWYGAANTFSAPRALLFQRISQFLSYTLWSFFLLAFVYTRKKYKKLSLFAAAGKRRERFSGVAAIATPVCSPA